MNQINIDVKAIPAPVMSAHCRTLLDRIGKFFDDPVHQAEYEAWHVEKYGHPPKEASYMSKEETK